MKKKNLFSLECQNPLKRLSLRLSLFVLLLFIPSFTFAFSEKDIISPLSGEWKNKQALVLRVADGEEVFYSLSGTDPLESGFSYDGPVLLDAEGTIELRISSLMPDGKRIDFFIKYTVDEYDTEENFASEKFIRSIRKNPIFEYKSGETYNMPEDMLYSFDCFTRSQLSSPLYLSSENTLERYVSCVMSSLHGEDMYHFVIHVVPVHRKKVKAKVKVPFEITGWENFSFLDRKYIYRIDEGEWLSPDSLRTLDRTSSHKISWQPVEYQESNTIHEYILPAKPNVAPQKNPDGTVTFMLEGDSRYSFDGETKKAIADAFSFEDIKGPAFLEVFCDGKTNGFISVDFEIDRLPPPAPLIESSAGDDVSRKTAFVKIAVEKGSSIYYSVYGPFDASSFMDLDFENSSSDNDEIDFQMYFGEDIPLEPSGEDAILYAIKSYAVDSSGNRGPSSFKTVILDDTNYYLDSSFSNSKNSDGTKDRPFSSFEEFLSVLSQSEKPLRLHITSDIKLPSCKICLDKSCSIEGNGSTLVFDEKTSLYILDCEIKISDCVLEKNQQSFNNKREESGEEGLIQAERSTLSLIGCEISGVYTDRAFLLKVTETTLNIDSSGFTVKGGPYATCILAEKSKVLCQESRFTSSAEVCVNVSLCNSGNNKSSFSSSSFTVIGNVGRGIEGIKALATVSGSEFTARLNENTRASCAIWSDTAKVESIENRAKGF